MQKCKNQQKQHPQPNPTQENKNLAIADLARGMVGQLISSCWRAGENAKDWMSNNKSKTGNKTKQNKQTHGPTKTKNSKHNPNKNKTKHHTDIKKTSSELSETVKLRFQN